MDCILVPLRFKKVIWAVRNVATIAVGFAVVLLLIMGASGAFQDATTAILFSTGTMMVITPLLIPGYMYEKISQSTVEFATDRINVLDRHGRCWREIRYDSITCICIEEIAGFFYGSDRYLNHEKYICFYCNGITERPNVSYANLYKSENFFMIGYQAELQNFIQQKITSSSMIMKANLIPITLEHDHR